MLVCDFEVWFATIVSTIYIEKYKKNSSLPKILQSTAGSQVEKSPNPSTFPRHESAAMKRFAFHAKGWGANVAEASASIAAPWIRETHETTPHLKFQLTGEMFLPLKRDHFKKEGTGLAHVISKHIRQRIKLNHLSLKVLPASTQMEVTQNPHNGHSEEGRCKNLPKPSLKVLIDNVPW